MRHFLRNLYFIIKKRNDWFSLLKAYLKIIWHAHLYHKFTRFLATEHPYFEIGLLGMHIRFFSYPSLLQLFEEIFIKEIYFFKSLNDVPIIVDCGSNIGLSVLYFKKQYPASSIIAFEPDSVSFEMLKQNIENNKLSEIILKNVGLAAAAGERIFFKTASERGSVNNSLTRSAKHDTSMAIRTESLSDHILQKTDFLKIDTEGAEGQILLDLCSSGKITKINQLFIEYHHQCDIPLSEIEKLMVKNGFASHFLDGDTAKNKQILYKRQQAN